jgi:iron complex outermembrane receptor protein
VRKSESELKFIDTKASTELWQMAGGPAGLALGIEFRDESLKDRPDAAAQSGDILGQGITGDRRLAHEHVDLRRDLAADPAFDRSPARLPLRPLQRLRQLHHAEGRRQVASAEHPRPARQLGQGFRAPTLVEISPSVATFFTQVLRPELRRRCA